jgi:pimeloyl-[acyl-carrier protein] methyl ester esterase
MAEPETRLLDTAEGPLAYHLLGDAPPRVTLLPGWGLHVPFLRTTAAWAALEAWAARHPLLALDRRGTGASRTNRGSPGPEQLAADLSTVLETLAVPEVALWAHADACLAALALAARDAVPVTRLILQAPFTRLLAGPDMPTGMAVEDMLALAALDPTAPVLRELAALGDAPGITDDAVTRFRAGLAAGFMPRLLSEVSVVDTRPLLPAVRVPVLILHGADDAVIPVSAAEALAHALPAARLHVIPTMGHLPDPAQLRASLAAVDAFLSG